MSIFPMIVVTMSTLTIIFWILKYCLKWNIFGVAEDKPASKLTILQKTKETKVASSEPEHKSQIEPSEANQENKEERPKESPHVKGKTAPLSTISTCLEKNESFPGEENEESSFSEKTINLSHNVKETHDLPTSEQSYPDDIIEEESFSSDHEFKLSPTKQSPITIKKTPTVKECSVIVKKLKVPIKGCGVFLKKCPTGPTETPVQEDLDSEQQLEIKTSSVSELENDSSNDKLDPNDKANARWRKPVAVATKNTVTPKTRVKMATKKPTIELPSPISINNNNSATKKKKKLFSLTPQKSEIFSPVEVESSEVDPRNVVMKQLRDRQPKRK